MVNILVTRLDVSACILLIIIDRMLYDFLMEIFIDYIHMNKLETRNKNNNIYSLKLKCNCSKENIHILEARAHCWSRKSFSGC